MSPVALELVGIARTNGILKLTAEFKDVLATIQNPTLIQNQQVKSLPLPLVIKEKLVKDLTELRNDNELVAQVRRKHFSPFPEKLKALNEAVNDLDRVLAQLIFACLNAPIMDDPSQKLQEALVEKVAESLAGFLTRSITPPKVITVDGIVVSYEHTYNRIQNFLKPSESAEQVEQTLRAVLTANANADLTILAPDLGIKIRSIQRKGDRPSEHSGPDRDLDLPIPE